MNQQYKVIIDCALCCASSRVYLELIAHGHTFFSSRLRRSYAFQFTKVLIYQGFSWRRNRMKRREDSGIDWREKTFKTL